ncbi:hypothetical protein [Actinomadura kijaniata]|uniref:hypothetical protein n=1 Tax=Actinomadura kijaniata TaxID=46161 RepID=UPI00082AFF7C|nr:hypothetical protein [Actinomadura kijaniata]
MDSGSSPDVEITHGEITRSEITRARQLGLDLPERRILNQYVRRAAAAARDTEDFFARLQDQGLRVERRTSQNARPLPGGYALALPAPEGIPERFYPAAWLGAPDLTLPRIQERFVSPLIAQRLAEGLAPAAGTTAGGGPDGVDPQTAAETAATSTASALDQITTSFTSPPPPIAGSLLTAAPQPTVSITEPNTEPRTDPRTEPVQAAEAGHSAAEIPEQQTAGPNTPRRNDGQQDLPPVQAAASVPRPGTDGPEGSEPIQGQPDAQAQHQQPSQQPSPAQASDDQRRAAYAQQLGDTLTVIANHAPDRVRDLLQAGASEYERAARVRMARVQDQLSFGLRLSTQALDGAAQSLGKGRDIAALALLTIAAAGAIEAAISWYKLQNLKTEQAAAEKALPLLRQAAQILGGDRPTPTSTAAHDPALRQAVQQALSGSTHGQSAASERVLTDPRWPQLAELLQQARRDGHDPAVLLTDAPFIPANTSSAEHMINHLRSDLTTAQTPSAPTATAPQGAPPAPSAPGQEATFTTAPPTPSADSATPPAPTAPLGARQAHHLETLNRALDGYVQPGTTAQLLGDPGLMDRMSRAEALGINVVQHLRDRLANEPRPAPFSPLPQAGVLRSVIFRHLESPVGQEGSKAALGQAFHGVPEAPSMRQIVQDPAWPALHDHIQVAARQGRHVPALLRHAVTQRDFTGVVSPTQVLIARIKTLTQSPSPNDDANASTRHQGARSRSTQGTAPAPAAGDRLVAPRPSPAPHDRHHGHSARR